MHDYLLFWSWISEIVNIGWAMLFYVLFGYRHEVAWLGTILSRDTLKALTPALSQVWACRASAWGCLRRNPRSTRGSSGKSGLGVSPAWVDCMVGKPDRINSASGGLFQDKRLRFWLRLPFSQTWLPCIHKSTQSHFPAKEGGIELSQTSYKSRHSRGSLCLVTWPSANSGN